MLISLEGKSDLQIKPRKVCANIFGDKGAQKKQELEWEPGGLAVTVEQDGEEKPVI